MLKNYKKSEVEDLIATGNTKTGSGINQTCTLQRAGATHWGSHLRSILSLIKLFVATQETITDLHENGVDKVRGEAYGIISSMKNYAFIYCVTLMREVMQNTEFLSQSFQTKDIDILNAVKCLSITKEKHQSLRDNRWNDLIKEVSAFCDEHHITSLDMCALYEKSKRSAKVITNEHHYRVNIFYVIIDHQLMELNNRFPENSMELFVLSASFHPQNDFQAFNVKHVCKLASKVYPSEFSEYEIVALKAECDFFLVGIKEDVSFANITSVSDLCRLLVTFRKSMYYPMIYKLICLVLTLPVSTATTERAFSSMNIIKSQLRNKINDEFLDDLMVL